VRFDRTAPQPRQRNSWSCFPTSLAWSVRALGHEIEAGAFGLAVLRDGIITPRGYLVDKTGGDLADFWRGQLASLGLAAGYQYDATFDQVAAEAGLYGVVIGSGSWLHYAAVRDFDAATGRLLLANSAPGWQRIGDSMSRAAFDRYRPISMTRIATPEIIGQIGEQVEHDRRRGIQRPQPVRAIYVPRVAAGRAPGGAAVPGLHRDLARPGPDRAGPGLRELRRQPAGRVVVSHG
jgi:hypothetical protein